MQIREFWAASGGSRRNAAVFSGPAKMHRIADRYAEILSCCARRLTRVTD